MPEFKNSKWELKVKPLTQRMVEGFAAEMHNQPGSKAEAGLVEYHGAVVRSAIVAGWIEAPVMTVEGVGDLGPGQVRWMAQMIDKTYQEAISIPPN